MPARIYQPPKNAMQSGRARTDGWVLEFVPAEAKKPDPLMGTSPARSWLSTADA